MSVCLSVGPRTASPLYDSRRAESFVSLSAEHQFAGIPEVLLGSRERCRFGEGTSVDPADNQLCLFLSYQPDV